MENDMKYHVHAIRKELEDFNEQTLQDEEYMGKLKSKLENWVEPEPKAPTEIMTENRRASKVVDMIFT